MKTLQFFRVMRFATITVAVCMMCNVLYAQNVGINATGAAPVASAMLDVTSTTSGFLVPRMTAAQRTSIGAPATGLLVYQTNGTNGFYYWDGTNWVMLFGPGGWSITGNAGTVAGTNFWGTTDAVQLDIRTNNTVRFRLASGTAAIRSNSNGTAGAPVYSWIADSDIGMYRVGTNNLGFSSAGLERLRLTSTSAVFNELSYNYDFRVESDAQFDMFFVDASTNRIGLNTSTPQNVVDFRTTGENIWLTYWENNNAANGAVVQWNQTNTTNGNRVAMGITNYSGIAFQSNGLIGLHLNGAGTGQGVNGFSNSWSGTGTYGGFTGGTNIFASGWAVFADGWGGGLTAWQNVSDKRLKKDIITIDNALSKVMKLRGVQYKFSRENFPDVNLDTETPQLGFVAQEVEEVFPFLVREANITGSSSTKTADFKDAINVYKVKSMGYASIVPVLVEAIKEQQAIIDDLTKRIEELEK